MNLQEMDIYMAAADGLFLYDPLPHGLKKISASDVRALTGKQDFVKSAPVNLIYVSDLSRMKRADESRREMFSWAHSGFISQKIRTITGQSRTSSEKRSIFGVTAVSAGVRRRAT